VEHHPEPGVAEIAIMSYRVLAEDAATNNIGSVTVLHSRVRVQAVSQEAQPVLRMFHDLAQLNPFAAHPPADGVSGTRSAGAVPFVQADGLLTDQVRVTGRY
jgi:hypothetical protein